MKLNNMVFKDPESCAAAITALAAQRKCTGNRELFFGNGIVLCDSVPKYSNDKYTVPTRVKGAGPALPAKLPDGSDVEIYYVSYNDTTQEQLDAAKNAIANGVDPRLVKGKLCDVKFAKEGHAVLLVTNSLRTTIDGSPSYRALSLKTGCVVAIAINRGLGLDIAKLKQAGDTYEAHYKAVHQCSPVLPMTGNPVAMSSTLPEDEEVEDASVPVVLPEAPQTEPDQGEEAPVQAAPTNKTLDILAKLKNMDVKCLTEPASK